MISGNIEVDLKTTWQASLQAEEKFKSILNKYI